MGYHVLQTQGAAQSGHISEIWRKQEGQGALVGYDLGVQKIENKIPSEVGPLGQSTRRAQRLPWQTHWGALKMERCAQSPARGSET